MMEKIILANQILDAFGNAATSKNRNATKYVKFLEINFSENEKVSGANFTSCNFLFWKY